jgi:hypothetical protein
MATCNNRKINNKVDINNIFNQCVNYETYIKNQLEYILTSTDDSDDNSDYKNMMFRRYITDLHNLYNIESVKSNFNNNSNATINHLNNLKMKISAAEQMVVLIDLFKPIFDNPNSHIDDINQPYNSIGITASMFAGCYVMPPTYDDDIKIMVSDDKVIGKWINQAVMGNFNNHVINRFINSFINASDKFDFRSDDNCMEITINKQRQNFQNGYVVFQRNLTIQNKQFIVFNDIWKFHFTNVINSS